MNEDFQLPISYKNKDLLLTSLLLQFGYVYKIEVELEDTKVHFERDDSGDWRTLLVLSNWIETKRLIEM